MPFTWAGCLDGSSIDLNRVHAFTVGQVQKHTDNGEPMFQDSEKKVPTLQMCVFALIDQHSFPIRVVSDMREAQVTVQSILAKLRQDYNKERNAVQVATADEQVALKLG